MEGPSWFQAVWPPVSDFPVRDSNLYSASWRSRKSVDINRRNSLTRRLSQLKEISIFERDETTSSWQNERICTGISDRPRFQCLSSSIFEPEDRGHRCRREGRVKLFRGTWEHAWETFDLVFLVGVNIERLLDKQIPRLKPRHAEFFKKRVSAILAWYSFRIRGGLFGLLARLRSLWSGKLQRIDDESIGLAEYEILAK